jgi:transcriptional regulator with XRE-family HTH domain
MATTRQPEPIADRVRRRLRELRTERGLTLGEVAQAADLDTSTLSRLESGKRRLSLDHVPALAAALDVSTDELLGAPPPIDPRVRGRAERHDGMTMWPLSHRATPNGLRVYRIQISAKRRRPPDPLPVHEGSDWLYVVSGRLRLILGEEDMTIEAGEAVEFTTLTPHWFGAADGPVELIGIFGAHGERLHLHS